MAGAQLTISSKKLLLLVAARLAGMPHGGLDFEEVRVAKDDPDQRQELLLLLSPSVLVPRLTHDGVTVWDTLAIAEYLNEIAPQAGLLPADRVARAHCRAVCGEMHSGFYNLRSALPMNLKARHKAFKIFSGARPDVERIKAIWTSVSTPMADPGCSGPRRRWPTPCMRRSAPGFAPMRSSSTRSSGPIARRFLPGR